MITNTTDSDAQGGFGLDLNIVPQTESLGVDELLGHLTAPDTTNGIIATGGDSVEVPEDGGNLLAKCEQTIRCGLNSSLAVGIALLVINRRKLYKPTHDTFRAYVETQCVFSRPHAYRLVQFAEVCSRLSPIRRQLPNEQQVRDLIFLRLSPTNQYRVWQLATFSGYATRQTFDAAIIQVAGEAAIRKLRAPRGEQSRCKIALRYTVNSESAETIKRASGQLGLSIQQFLDAAVAEKVASLKPTLS